MIVPEDTSDRDPVIHLAGLMGGQERYITEMEAAGQTQLVNSDVLPINCWNDEPALIALGFTFGEPVDDLFRKATLPEGWIRTGSAHAMWSHVLDDRGIERIAIFYKAAFYDRSAHMSVVNVGGALASAVIYRENPDGVPWDVLTADEQEGILRPEA